MQRWKREVGVTSKAVVDDQRGVIALSHTSLHSRPVHICLIAEGNKETVTSHHQVARGAQVAQVDKGRVNVKHPVRDEHC